MQSIHFQRWRYAYGIRQHSDSAGPDREQIPYPTAFHSVVDVFFFPQTADDKRRRQLMNICQVAALEGGRK